MEQERNINREDWLSGPWDNEPDRLIWKTTVGLTGMIVRNGLGALCGYVAVPTGHYLYGKDYFSLYVDVHGGLTYGNSCQGHICHVPEPGEPDDVWWFGFDCAHPFDRAPNPFGDYYGSGTYRTIDYVQGEVEKLAKQLI